MSRKRALIMQCAAVATNFLETENEKNRNLQLQMRLRVIVMELTQLLQLLRLYNAMWRIERSRAMMVFVAGIGNLLLVQPLTFENANTKEFTLFIYLFFNKL